MYSQYCTIQNDQKDIVTACTWDYIYTAKISVPIIVVLKRHCNSLDLGLHLYCKNDCAHNCCTLENVVVVAIKNPAIQIILSRHKRYLPLFTYNLTS